MSFPARSWRTLFLAGASGALLAACGGEAAPPAMPTPEVTVVTLKTQPLLVP
mgnify:FL=1